MAAALPARGRRSPKNAVLDGCEDFEEAGSTRFARTPLLAITLTLFVSSFGLATPPAFAQEVTFAFSGIVDFILPRGTLPAYVTEGDVLTGRYTFDSSAVGNFGGPGTEIFFAACRVEIEIEDLVYGGEENMSGPAGGS